MSGRPRRAALPCRLLALSLLALGCRGERATAAQCQEIVDRIVFLELSEMGFTDPKLLAQKQAEMRRALQTELEACPGRRLPGAAMECVRKSQSTEALSHVCLR